MDKWIVARIYFNQEVLHFVQHKYQDNRYDDIKIRHHTNIFGRID
ncbi:hypothetical protein H1P_100003 [Hyella patelloides LEGE 07179]|uniref:Uncharacterized protein n=1 Tax=Hyella patelloides LEGE 07179 TaxID=945734 RepID=A0A563VIS1_9CYAN|nr:hypothetical protein H1P_100003 [Hyella patelloides LEGE 07179]